MVAFLLVLGLVSAFGWNQWNHQPQGLLAGVPYLLVSALCLTAIAYLSLQGQ